MFKEALQEKCEMFGYVISPAHIADHLNKCCSYILLIDQNMKHQK